MDSETRIIELIGLMVSVIALVISVAGLAYPRVVEGLHRWLDRRPYSERILDRESKHLSILKTVCDLQSQVPLAIRPQHFELLNERLKEQFQNTMDVIVGWRAHADRIARFPALLAFGLIVWLAPLRMFVEPLDKTSLAIKAKYLQPGFPHRAIPGVVPSASDLLAFYTLDLFASFLILAPAILAYLFVLHRLSRMLLRAVRRQNPGKLVRAVWQHWGSS